jgi:hypothetical protein
LMYQEPQVELMSKPFKTELRNSMKALIGWLLTS